MEILVFLAIVYIIYNLMYPKNKKTLKRAKKAEESIDIKFVIEEENPIISIGNTSLSSYQSPTVDIELKEKIKRLEKIISALEVNISSNSASFKNDNYKIDYAKELNAQQLNAVTSIAGKTLVIAGAGSGKTRTLIYRTSYLIENGIDSSKILLLTFTKKAANEIKIRVNSLLANEKANKITTGTFHAFCNMLLAKYSKILQISPKFTILDQGDSEDLLDLLKKQNNYGNSDKIPFPKKGTLQTIISMSRNKLISIKNVIEDEYPNYICYLTEILDLYNQYMQYKKENNLYDYDDLIDEVSNHLETNPAFKAKIKNSYKYIMVDEYQDTNIPQKRLIDLMADTDDISLMAVGDDNQSIYAFRGANYQNILLFGETYPNAKLIKLEQNYRSSKNILNFVNGISDNIALGYKKELFCEDQTKSLKPEVIRFIDEEQEAEFIAGKIVKSYGRLKYQDFAILCRSSFHSNSIQLELLKRNIPFVVYGGIKFIEKRHIKDIIAYFKVMWNPLDMISWNRILTLLNGVGKVTAQKTIQVLRETQGNLDLALNSNIIKRNEAIYQLFEMIWNALNFSNLIESFSVIEAYYVEILKKLEDDWKNRIEDFKVIRRLCSEYKNIEDFLSNLALDPPSNTKAIYEDSDKLDDAVTISTIHSAKGLEWNTVFIISLIDGAVPHYRSFNDYEKLEEERKLFYVVCSRAKENLYLTAPSYYNTYAAYFDKISRFITEVDKNKYVVKE